MARIKSIYRYPISAYGDLYAAAREAAASGEAFAITCETFKEAESRRFELYGFLRALSKSTELGHMNMLKEFQSFKLTLFRTGAGDKTLLRFMSYDNSAFAQDIMKQVGVFRAGLPVPEATPEPAPESTPTQDALGSAQEAVFRKLGYLK